MLNVIFLFLTFFIYHPVKPQDYHVLDFNATGNGVTDDTLAVRAAALAAKNSNGGRVIFDAGYVFLTGGFNITSNVILDVRGTILGIKDVNGYPQATVTPWMGSGQSKQPLVYSYNATNVTITGGGLINGQGDYWYPCMLNGTVPPCYPHGRPRLTMLSYTSNIVIENVTFKDSPSWTLHIAWADNVYINNITILSPHGQNTWLNGTWLNTTWLNTDGIDIDCSKNVTVENSYIDTADDAICLKSGISTLGQKYGRLTENIMIRNLYVGYSFGLSIGTEIAMGIKNVTFRDNTRRNEILRTFRNGTVEDITYTNITAYNTNITTYSGILLSLNTIFAHATGHDNTSMPVFKNIILNNFTASNIEYMYDLRGRPESPIQNVYFSNINVTNLVNRLIDNGCTNITGTCDSNSVFPQCPPCLTTESCFDASDSCSSYLNLCNLPSYHSFMCDQCRKTCNLCNSC